MDSLPELSVVLPVRNEAAFIDLLLQDLAEQDLPEHCYELIVVDGRSGDATRSIVRERMRRSANLRLVDNPGRRASPGRNTGVRHSRGQYVLFVDGHCRVPSRSMLREVLEAFHAGARCISRPQPLIASRGGPAAEAIARTRSSRFGHMPGSMIFRAGECTADPSSAGCGYAREVLDQLGAFDEAFEAAEDVQFNARVRAAGIRAVHSPRFAVHYVARDTWGALARQLFRYGLGRGRLLFSRHFAASLPALLPLVVVSALLGGAILADANTGSVLAVLAAPSGFVVFGTMCSVARSRPRCPPGVVALAAPTLVLIHACSAAGTVVGLVRALGQAVRARLRGPRPAVLSAAPAQGLLETTSGQRKAGT